MTYEEIGRIVAIFSELGVSKVRLTGGEPLLRKDIIVLVDKINKIPGIKEIPLSTNAELLGSKAKGLKESGITGLNISIDSLNKELFSEITRGGNVDKVISGIDKAIEEGFTNIKINMVVMNERNSQEIPSMLDFAISRGIDIRFIETMPIGLSGSEAMKSHLSQKDIEIIVNEHLGDRVSSDKVIVSKTAGPAKMKKIHGTNTKFGVISAVSNKFCGDCNRVRITSKGVLVLCLGQENSVDLMTMLRQGSTDEEIKDRIILAITKKPKEHVFETNADNSIEINMVELGG
jgi:cyclic pyranopterin phosphate synthase